MSLAMANDFAFPNEDIRRASIRKTTFNLAKTGDQRSDPSGATRGEKILTIVFVP